MTDTTTSKQDTSATPLPGQTGTMEHIDPTTVEFEDNVRVHVDLDDELIESIRSEGVLLPVLARRAEDGTIYVRDGQRRTLAARQAGLATIPAYFGTLSESAVARITQQLVTNDRRAAISKVERVNAYHQLALEGMTPAAIARKTGEKKATIEASITVAKSAYATEVISTGQITLDAALILVEFEDDPEVAEQLTETAIHAPERLPHATERARQDRARAAQVAAVAAEHTEAGIRALTGEDAKLGIPLSNLTAEENSRTPLDPENHTGCPGHALRVFTYWDGSVKTSSVCIDATDHGHFFLGGTSSPGAAQGGPMTERQKAERRQVIENNKASDAAKTVRITWLTTFLSRKALPKDAAEVIARGLTTHRSITGSHISAGNDLALKLLGAEGTENRWGTDRLGQYVTAHPLKAQHVTLAVILGAQESVTSRDTWRRVDHHAADYLETLARWGYVLSDVEQLVVDTAAASPRR
jgi:ParB family chromosome partitioning protein